MMPTRPSRNCFSWAPAASQGNARRAFGSSPTPSVTRSASYSAATAQAEPASAQAADRVNRSSAATRKPGLAVVGRWLLKHYADLARGATIGDVVGLVGLLQRVPVRDDLLRAQVFSRSAASPTGP